MLRCVYVIECDIYIYTVEVYMKFVVEIIARLSFCDGMMSGTGIAGCLFRQQEIKTFVKKKNT